MNTFLFGLAIGLVIAFWIHRRASKQQIVTNIAIYEGWLTPDENGNLGYSRFPDPNRFPEVGEVMPVTSKVEHPVTEPLREGKINKGGQNVFPSQVTTRPPPPTPTRPISEGVEERGGINTNPAGSFGTRPAPPTGYRPEGSIQPTASAPKSPPPPKPTR
jgi:hypothetical protein